VTTGAPGTLAECRTRHGQRATAARCRRRQRAGAYGQRPTRPDRPGERATTPPSPHPRAERSGSGYGWPAARERGLPLANERKRPLTISPVGWLVTMRGPILNRPMCWKEDIPDLLLPQWSDWWDVPTFVLETTPHVAPTSLVVSRSFCSRSTRLSENSQQPAQGEEPQAFGVLSRCRRWDDLGRAPQPA
jgi:hypothetical protein